jgi:phosphohistidine phosphatase
MKSVLIVRHAKSSWKHPDINDHDRPLNKWGKRDAPYMGDLLQNEDLVPDLIISSTAKRTYSTAKTGRIRRRYSSKPVSLCSTTNGLY